MQFFRQDGRGIAFFLKNELFQKAFSKIACVQVHLCQKYLFLLQLTHNMTKDCSLNYEFSTWTLQIKNSEQLMYTTCSELAVFMYWTRNSMNNLLSYCWFKNKCFWKRFTWMTFFVLSILEGQTGKCITYKSR